MNKQFKVRLYMAISANGYIATADDATPWSDEEWKSYSIVVSKTKNIIIGRRTYEIMRRSDEFSKLDNPKVIVVTHHKHDELKDTSVIPVTNPLDAIQAVKNLGYDTALVTGGTLLNTSFMNSGLVDELFLDIEPVLIGTGIPLFGVMDSNTELKLDQINQLGENTVQLRYSLIR